MIHRVNLFVLVVIVLSKGIAIADIPQPPKATGATSPATGKDIQAEKEIRASFGKLPLYFIKNEGQKDKDILFYEQGSGHVTAFTKERILLSLAAPGKQKGIGEAVSLTPLNASPSAVEAVDRMGGRVNYFIGNDPKQWKRDIPTFGAVVYRDVYPGIDMKFYGTNSLLEYDIIVSPGADPSKVRLSYAGIEKLSLTPQGELEITLKEGSLFQKKPFIYQTFQGEKREVSGKFVLLDKSTYGFEIGVYDRSRPLVIDPALVYSTYLGGGGQDFAQSIAVDDSGSAYVAGYTYSPNFPTKNPFQGSLASGYDAFVTKFSPSGDALVYSTYLGGNSYDYAYAIAVDSSGSAYVAGYTYSPNFPTVNAFQGSHVGGTYDAFVTKFTPTGDALVYSTYLGGNSYYDYAYAIAVDSSGSAYVAGYTGSTNFPTKNAFQGSHSGGTYDAFVTKFSPSGDALVYSTYLGGNSKDEAFAIAVDASGSAYVAGYTDSPNFPTKNPYQGYAGGVGYYDVFVTKFSPSGDNLIYSTYLGGGSGSEIAKSIAVDSSGSAYVAGYTGSRNFPTVNAFQASLSAGSDAFVTKFTPTGDALVYSTYLGGNDNDFAYAIAVGASGSAYVAGNTSSTNFPTVNAFQTSLAGGSDAFVTKFSPSGNALVYSTYLGGGSSYDEAFAIAVGSSESVYVAGYTLSTNFPTVNAFQVLKAMGYDSFVSKFTLALPELIETYLHDPPANVAIGESFSATETVRNDGESASGASLTRYYMCPTTSRTGACRAIGTRSAPPLEAHTANTGTVSVIVPGGISAGAYYLLACADDTMTVDELCEFNNCTASGTTTQLTGPDLIETDLQNPPATASTGTGFPVIETVHNQGEEPAGPAVTRYYLSPTTTGAGRRLLAGTRSVPALSAQGSNTGTVTVTIPLTIPAAAYYLLACADDLHTVPETIETNNCKSSATTLTVMVAPDLVETYLTNPPTNATLGSSFYLTDTAKNIGSAGAGNSVTHYFLSTTTVRDSKSRILQGVRYVPILSPGASSWGTVKATIPAGIPSASYYLLACADDKQVIVEGNETNNCKASSSRVALTTPDLVETGITDPPSTGKVGSRFSITDVVKNYGNASASASVTRYYLSTTNVKSSAAKLLTGSRSIPALNPQALSSGTASITVPSTVPVGYSYYLLACADDTNTVVEVNEINNCKASMTTILITP